jgi:very-short-patch-repair endonuclease
VEQAGKNNHWAYNKALQPNANALRKRMTKAEACLWKYVLRADKMKNYGFRRQRPVMNHIADFMCKELMLIIEVDGYTHWTDEAKINDAERDRVLKMAGFTILRFSDEEVLSNLSQVENKIKHWIDLKTQK